MSLEQFADKLKSENIDLVIRENKEGVVYGITYVDHKNAVVFNGSDLGKAYSAKEILERCKVETYVKKEAPVVVNQKAKATQKPNHAETKKQTLLELLVAPNSTQDYVTDSPGIGKQKRKKKRKQ